jgi:hypothetical protein
MVTRKSSPITPADNIGAADALRTHAETVLAENEALADALQTAQQALQRRANIEAAIARTRAQTATAKRRVEEIDDALPDLDAQLALAGGDAAIDSALEDEVARLQAQVDDATRERTDKHAEIERSVRTIAVLEKEIVAVDADVVAARSAVDAARAAARTDLMPHLDEAVTRACAELARVRGIMRSLALVGVPLEDDAAALRIVRPSEAFHDTSGGEVIAHGEDLLEQVEPVPVRAPDGLSDVVRQLRAHRPYTVAQESVFERALRAPYQTRSASPERIAEIERFERGQSARPTAQRASMPVSWTGGRQ